MDALRRAFTGGAVAWAVALPLATFAASRPHTTTLASLGSLSVYAVGALVCHQLPVRSFHVWGAQMPVCARCTGIYVGAALGAVVACAGVVRLKPVGLLASPRAAALVALAPTAATLLYEWTTGAMPSNWMRFAAGVWLGAIIAAMLVAATSTPGREVN